MRFCYKLFSLVLLGCMFLAGEAAANYRTYYVWYRPIPEENRVVIKVENLWGRDAVERFEENQERLEKEEGKYYLHDHYGPDAPSREVVKEEKLDEYDIRTEITINYPRGHGLGGALPWVYIKVYVDDELRMDTPLGYNHRHSLTVSKVVIHGCDSYGFIRADVLYESAIHFRGVDQIPTPKPRVSFNYDDMLKLQYGVISDWPMPKEEQ